MKLFLYGLLFIISFNEGDKKEIIIESPAFKYGEFIPVKYTCEGKDISPPLAWKNIPEGTKGVVLICDDPDAPGGTWVHWVIYNIPPDLKELKEGIPPEKELRNGIMQGRNSWDRIGYGGPCPPPGHGVHRYFFKIYAIDKVLEFSPGMTKEEILKIIKGHIIAEGKLMGKFKRDEK